ncbi:uncharacterized protein LOC123311629 [Coccinella septempunctata]|uniref:uncharacterized protein LOC123311629 n=1 Tax=Coccinella septempunctata TaxID=41139 RepID=UPI001D095B0E|nr:uncharacterized protein LOC123311629 [Coccinella septempunctata]
MGNLYPDEKGATTVKNCREVDKEVRKVLIENNIKGKTTTNNHIYLPVSRGGQGMKFIEVEAEIHMVKKGVYIRSHPEMQEAHESYIQLQGSGWRNPLSDHDFVSTKYGCPDVEYTQTKITKNCKTMKKHIEKPFYEQLEKEWIMNMHYGRIFVKEQPNIELPAYTSPLMDSWRFSLLHSAAEEQVHGLVAILGRRKNCRRGCSQSETAYHVSSACIQDAYNTRHDYVVHWVLKSLLSGLNAPEDIQLQFGKATLSVDFFGMRRVEIRAGTEILTEKRIHHNTPDTYLHLYDPEEIIILEISVAHLQNYRLQEKIKKVRYSVNGSAHIDHTNVDEACRDLNLMGELRSTYRCPVHLGVFVVGCFGEIVTTEEHKNIRKILIKIGINNLKMRILINRSSYSVAVSTSNIILKHLCVVNSISTVIFCCILSKRTQKNDNLFIMQ